MSNIRIKGLVDMLVRSYDKHTDIIKVNTNNQLNKSIIIDILEKLRCLLFPGYFGKKNLNSDFVEYYVGDLLEDVIFNLTRQIAFAIQRWETFDPCKDGNFDKAKELCFAFLEKLSIIREYLDADVDAAFDGDPAAESKDEIISSYPGLYAIMVSRLAHELYLLSVPLIPRIMTEHAHSLTGIDIHPGASIGRYFFIDHGTGIVIGETTTIGDHVKLYQGVTLGALSTRDGRLLKNAKRHPTIENHVTIYSGASILGGETVIKEGVVVGSNAFITSSVPEKTKVSIKNQELQYKRDHKSYQPTWEDNWYYTI
ncbi:MAG: serine acetyltransferase [Treponema sp.]|jgi:serine O-acetyltransferase|nr:serine acetyltransferase [Treponema sp.]